MSGTVQHLWLRWVLRDLRERWLLVLAIALVLALGTGSYAALSGTSTWRTVSNDASFAELAFHDVEVALTPGSVVPQGTLLTVIDGLAAADGVTAAEERLLVPTQVVVDTPSGDQVLVPGRMVGADAEGVDRRHVEAGRAVSADDRVPTALLEQKFAAAHDLPSSGEVIVRGTPVSYVGLGMGPEDFIVDAGGVAVLSAESGFASVYSTLEGAQAVAGGAAVVNDLVLRLDPAVDRAALVEDLRAALASLDPPVSASVTTRDDEASYQVLYEDIEGDAQFWTVVSLLMIAGATLAAVNLIGRVMDGQRREIGIGMALGVPRRRLAIRPFVLAGAIAVLGVALGLAVGALLVVPLRGVYTGLLPLPVWQTPLVAGPFVVAAAVGVAVPVVATAWPVWKALRVEPVTAIRVGHLAATGAGWSRLAASLPLPGGSLAQIPVRNVLRTPRRTLLTAAGVAAALGLIVSLGGILDSFGASLQRAERETVGDVPDRLVVTLERPAAVDADLVASVQAVAGVDETTPALQLPATARAEGTDGVAIELVVEVLDPQSAPWRPTITTGEAAGGLVITDVAARDLDVDPGDWVVLDHPRLTATGLEQAESVVAVAGTHPHPLRPLAYLDPTSADVFGPGGFANLLIVVPDQEADVAQVRQALATIPGVAAVAGATDIVDQLSEALDQIVGVLGVVALVSLVLAGLIAVNSASIAAEERRREHATMRAFGLSPRTVLRLSMAEGALLGLLGTAFGLALGTLLTWLVVDIQVPQTLPDVGVAASIGVRTVVIALALGVGAVALAPLATARTLARMDLPGTLRLVE